MFLLVEIDRNWCGIGIDRWTYIKGIRLGWIAIRIMLVPFTEFVDTTNKHYHTKRLEQMHAEVDAEMEAWQTAPRYSDVLH